MLEQQMATLNKGVFFNIRNTTDDRRVEYPNMRHNGTLPPRFFLAQLIESKVSIAEMRFNSQHELCGGRLESRPTSRCVAGWSPV